MLVLGGDLHDLELLEDGAAVLVDGHQRDALQHVLLAVERQLERGVGVGVGELGADDEGAVGVHGEAGGQHHGDGGGGEEVAVGDCQRGGLLDYGEEALGGEDELDGLALVGVLEDVDGRGLAVVDAGELRADLLAAPSKVGLGCQLAIFGGLQRPVE